MGDFMLVPHWQPLLLYTRLYWQLQEKSLKRVATARVRGSVEPGCRVATERLAGFTKIRLFCKSSTIRPGFYHQFAVSTTISCHIQSLLSAKHLLQHIGCSNNSTWNTVVRLLLKYLKKIVEVGTYGQGYEYFVAESYCCVKNVLSSYRQLPTR